MAYSWCLWPCCLLLTLMFGFGHTDTTQVVPSTIHQPWPLERPTTAFRMVRRMKKWNDSSSDWLPLATTNVTDWLAKSGKRKKLWRKVVKWNRHFKRRSSLLQQSPDTEANSINVDGPDEVLQTSEARWRGQIGEPNRSNRLMICMHLMEPIHDTSSEQFNLIRKCFPAKMAMKNSHAQQPPPSYSPIIKWKSRASVHSAITEPNDETATSPAPEATTATHPVVNVYEYKTEETIEPDESRSTVKPTVDTLAHSPSSTSADYYDSDRRSPGPPEIVPTVNGSQEMSIIKDLWQVNRRKKQSREMWQTTTRCTETSGNCSIESGNVNPSGRLRIPKLLLPKVNRPAMYSLNGFVPKPSLQRLMAVNGHSNNHHHQQQHSRNLKRNRKSEAVSNDVDDDIDVSESIRRQSKGEPAVNSLRPKLNRKRPTSSVATAVAPLNSIPKTGFDCGERTNGIYADQETGCQVWHVCQNGAKHSFLCPTGTVFNVQNGVCDWWYNTRCG